MMCHIFVLQTKKIMIFICQVIISIEFKVNNSNPN